MENIGQCKQCLSENLTYDASEMEDNQIYYPYYCEDCHHEGKEWYKLVYVETE
jgi:hypothetical protein